MGESNISYSGDCPACGETARAVKIQHHDPLPISGTPNPPPAEHGIDCPSCGAAMTVTPDR